MLGLAIACEGNQCCPGYSSSVNKSFPCPSADPNKESASMIRYDLYTASLMSFSNVVHDSLSAKTADTDGEASSEQFAWYAGD